MNTTKLMLKKMCLLFLCYAASATAHAALCVDGIDVSSDPNEDGDCLVWDKNQETRIPESKGHYELDTHPAWPGIYFVLNDDWINDPFLVNFPDTATLNCEQHETIFANKDCGLVRLLNIDNLFGASPSPLSYTWNPGGSEEKVYATKTEPSERVAFGMTKAGLDRVDDQRRRRAFIDAISAAGVETLVMNMSDVIMFTGDPVNPVADHYLFERVMDTIRYAKDLPNPINFVMVVLPPNDFYKAFVVYKDSREFFDHCGWYGSYPFTVINTGVNTGELPDRLDWAFRRFTDVIDSEGNPIANPDPLTNIIGIEYANELDSVCFNGNIPFPGPNDQPNFGEKQAVADHYARLVTIVKEKMDEHLSVTHPGIPLITYGGTKSFQRTSESPVAWDNFDLLNRIFSSQFYGNTTVPDPIDIVGQHIYPDLLDVDTDLVNILYGEISQLNNSATLLYDGSMTVGQLVSGKDIWLTEWGFNRHPVTYAHTEYEPKLRYRGMLEVMEHVNNDTNIEATMIKKAFLFGVDDPNYGVFHDLNGSTVPAMPEFRIVAAYADGIPGLPSGDLQDTDNDGLQDLVEKDVTFTDPLNSDTDGDGLVDGLEVAYDGVTVTYPLNTSPFEEDTDGDSLPDGWENFYGFDPVATDNASGDPDGDGLTNLEEYENLLTPIYSDTANYDNSPPSDLDWDGLTDHDEIRIYGTHPRDVDTDNDYIFDGDEVLVHQSDPLSLDSDGDGMLDEIEVLYGYALNSNDTDGDCPPNPEPDDPCLDPNEDFDGDGISNINEFNAGMEIDVANNPNLDSDGDGISDGDEASIYQTDPFSYDSDNDGWLDSWEINNFQTDPNSQDTDNDLVKDKLDNCPLTPNREQHDADSDNVGNVCDADFVAVKNDFNADGIVDHLWWKTGQSDLDLWMMDAFDAVGEYYPVVRYDNFEGVVHNNSLDVLLQTDEVIEGVADINGDKMADVIVKNTADNYIKIFLMDGFKPLDPDTDYIKDSGGNYASYFERTFMAAGDFNGDGRAQIIWRSKWGNMEINSYSLDATTVSNRVWLTNDTGGFFNAWAQEFSNPADMNGDGTDDIVARKIHQWGFNYLYEINGTVVTTTVLDPKTPTPQDWHMAGVGDFGNDENQSPGLNNRDIVFIKEYNGNQPEIDFRFLTNASDGYNNATTGDLNLDLGLSCSFGVPNYFIDGVDNYDGSSNLSELLMRAPDFEGTTDDYTLIIQPSFTYDELVDPNLDPDSDMDPMVDWDAYSISEDGTTPIMVGGSGSGALSWRNTTSKQWIDNICN